MRIVVAAALLVDGRVLAARRTEPPELAGGWEFPGGKPEPGETPQDALARECLEELGVVVRVGDRLGVVADGIELHLYAGEIAAGIPLPLQDHDKLRWVRSGELDDVEWLPIDRLLLEVVRPLLT